MQWEEQKPGSRGPLRGRVSCSREETGSPSGVCVQQSSVSTDTDQLMEPVDNLEDRMCRKHDKPLELFCQTDQTCVCMLCSVLDHRTHEFVPLTEGYEGKNLVTVM
ncbi:hypothetical protein INR49_010292, partial [Caranx melampygus]